MSLTVTIGSGDRRNSAITVGELNLTHDVSENQNCYWVSTSWFGTAERGEYLPELNLTIFKNTPEGESLKSKIEGRRAGKLDADKIDDWLHELALQNAEPRQLLAAIRAGMGQAYRHGSQKRAEAIREALGISR